MITLSALLIHSEDSLVDARNLSYELVFDEEKDTKPNDQYLSDIEDILKLLFSVNALMRMFPHKLKGKHKEQLDKFESANESAQGICELAKFALRRSPTDVQAHQNLSFSVSMDTAGQHIESAIQVVQDLRNEKIVALAS